MPENAAAEGGFGRDAPSRSDNDNDRGGAREDKESKTEKAESFDRAMDNTNRPDRAPAGATDTAATVDEGDDDGDRTNGSDDRSDRAAGPPGIGAPPSSSSLAGTSAPTDDTDDGDSAAHAAGASHHASEFSGLGASGGPVDNTLSGNASLNSHRGYGPDDSLAGGIDDDVNAGLEAADANHPANEFSGLGASGGPTDDSLAGGIDDDVNAGASLEALGSFDRPVALDIAGYGAAGVAGYNAVRGQYANIKGINTVADKLGSHPTANLPTHPGSTVSNADYVANDLSKQKKAAKALANHPAQGGAMRGVLEDAANTASKYGRTATGIGIAFDPVVTGTTAAITADGDWTDKATAAVVEGAKRLDNAIVSLGAGAFAGGVTIAGTVGTGTLAAPATGALAGIAAGELYSGTGPDAWIDNQVERARPAVEAVFDGVDSAVDASVDIAQDIGNTVSQGFEALMDMVASDDDNSADPDMNVAP